MAIILDEQNEQTEAIAANPVNPVIAANRTLHPVMPDPDAFDTNIPYVVSQQPPAILRKRPRAEIINYATPMRNVRPRFNSPATRRLDYN